MTAGTAILRRFLDQRKNMTYNKLILKSVRKYPWLIISAIILGFSGALFNGVSLVLVVPVILAFIGQDSTAFQRAPQFLNKLLSLFDFLPKEQRVIAMFLAVLLAIILKSMTGYVNSLVSSHLSRNLVKTMRLEGTDLLLNVDLDYYVKNKLGNITHYINNDLGAIATSIKTLINIVTTVITITFFVFLLISLSWELTIITVTLLGAVAFINQFFIRRSRKFGKILSQKSRAHTNKQFEVLTGIRLVKTSGQEKKEYDQIKKLIEQKEKAEFDSQVNAGLIGPFNEISGIATVLFMVIAGRYIFALKMQDLAPILLTYLVILFRLLPVVNQLNSLRNQLANLSHSMDVATKFLRRDNKPFMMRGNEIFTQFKEGIRFENIYFSYPKYDEIVLKGVDFWIPKGKMVALVGASGSGKSTIADLLPRFYDPTAGRITIDGKDLKDYELRSLRRAMGIVSQDTFLFNNSVHYNISYGVDNVTEEEIIEAAKRANAYEFIIQLPQDFATEIGDRGVMLSGGQRQRIAIARALLRNPDILILDEATSALDTVSERLVQQAINELSQERTTLVIAHRLSTIQQAHNIIVLDKGTIMEMGTHEELLEKGGYYTRLYSIAKDVKSKLS
jgi:subfamily B ATP-binding cassette protein MsbA